MLPSAQTAVVLLSLAVAGAGCAGHRPTAAPAAPAPPAPPHHVARQRTPAMHKRAQLVVTVIDGDRWLRIAGARVRLDGRTARTNLHGVAEIRVPWRRPLEVTVSAAGYAGRTVHEPFDTSRKVTVSVYRPELGRVLWHHDTPQGHMASSPAVVGDGLVYHTMDGHVFVLDRRSGALRWSFSVGSPIESSPLVHAGVDYFGAWNGRLYALDLRTRHLRWSRELGAKITASVAFAGQSLFVGDYAGRVWSLSVRTGATRWVRPVNGRVYGSPAVAGGRVFVPSSSGDSLTAFTAPGRFLWRLRIGSYVYSSPAVWGGRVFFGAYNGVFYGVSAASGRIFWSIGTGGPISGAAVVVDGVAYAGSFAHRIVGVDARSGRVLLRFRHGEYVPVSGNGMLLLLHGYSTLYAVRPRR